MIQRRLNCLKSSRRVRSRSTCIIMKGQDQKFSMFDVPNCICGPLRLHMCKEYTHSLHSHLTSQLHFTLLKPHYIYACLVYLETRHFYRTSNCRYRITTVLLQVGSFGASQRLTMCFRIELNRLCYVVALLDMFDQYNNPNDWHVGSSQVEY